MATVWFTLARIDDPEHGSILVEYSANNANWKILQIRATNSTPFAAVAIILKAGEPLTTITLPAQTQDAWNVAGVQLGWQPDYWNSLTETWEKAGIDMLDYTFGVRWPA